MPATWINLGLDRKEGGRCGFAHRLGSHNFTVSLEGGGWFLSGHRRVPATHLIATKGKILTDSRFYSAGELTTEELERIVTILQTPTQYKIPSWFLNRQRDVTDGKDSQVVSNSLDSKTREDLERLKKIRSHRGLRHYWGLRVRGQHTKTTGRRGRTVGVSKKKG